MADYVAPRLNLDAFNCPNCAAYAHQISFPRVYAGQVGGMRESVDALSMSKCARCDGWAIWRDADGAMIHPQTSIAPLASPDMPEDVAVDYNEARNVFGDSVRAAGGLLRLAIQKTVSGPWTARRES